MAVNVDLEMEVAADRPGVTGLAHGADSLSGPDGGAAMKRRGTAQVRVEVASLLPFAVDQQVVAVEDRVVTGAEHLAASHSDQRRAAGRHDVEAFMPAPTAAGRAVFTDRPPRPMRPLHRKDVVVVTDGAVGSDELGGRRSGERREQRKGEEKYALQ